MKLEEVDFISKNIVTTNLCGCDSSVANVFLYQDRYKISSFVKSDIFFRFYDTTPNHTGFGFPIPFKSALEDFLKTALEEILKSENQRFCYITEKQKELIDAYLAEYFPEYKINWESFRGDSDYLYLQSDLANLPGKDYQKKRNHLSRFNRTYGENWQFKTFPEENIKNDILAVEEKWFTENDGKNNPDLQSEYSIIKNAVQNAEKLNILGAVLYINGEPSAMCLASPVSDQVLDVLFEKSISETAENGSYAAINKMFASHCSAFKYLNREEDLGIEGLRKAKLSYKPEIILDKYFGDLVRK